MEINNKKVQEIFKKLHKNGFKALIVGGAVRDYLLGNPSYDFDILTDACIDQIIVIFKAEKVKIVGQSFKVCLINGIEVCPERAVGNKKYFPVNDLEMRDFTINSMAYDPQNKSIIDSFSGKDDLTRKIIRFTKDPNKRIKEDP